jgi:hypothetical protein
MLSTLDLLTRNLSLFNDGVSVARDFVALNEKWNYMLDRLWDIMHALLAG